MDEARTWPAQEKQDAYRLEILIDGDPDWKAFLNEEITLNTNFWIKRCGGEARVPLVRYLRAEAEVNNVSFERGVLNALLNKGFELQELEVEFWSEERKTWGVCSWYKNHPLYAEPIEGFENAHPRWTGYIRSMFKTENAGDQEFCLFSTQMISAALTGTPCGILLHKSLLFRKAVFTSPQKVAAAA